MQYGTLCGHMERGGYAPARIVHIGLTSFHMGRNVQVMPYPTERPVVEYIDAARREKGLSINEFARLSGLSARTVAVKLAGDRPLKLSDLYRFAAALGTSPAQIYSDLS